MGNSLVSKKQPNLSYYNPNRLGRNKFGNINYSMKSSANYMPNSNNINSNFNDLKDLDENDNKKNKYFFGFRQKSKNLNKTQINKNKPNNLNRKTNNQNTHSQNKTLSNIKKYAFYFLPQYYVINNDENMNNNAYKKQNYIKKYKNDDKFYRYGKKSNTIKGNDNDMDINIQNNKLYSTDIINNKDKIIELINDNRSKKSKSQKKEKSSQFVLLNSSFNKNNLFNVFHEANNEQNNNYNYTILDGNNNKLVNNLRLTTINEPNVSYNFTNVNDDNYDNLNIDNMNISQNSTIKYNTFNYTQTSFIYNKPQLLLEKLNGYLDSDDENEKNNNFKETNEATIPNIYESTIVNNNGYKLIRYNQDINKKELGKVIYKNKVILMSYFEDNEINGPIIISDHIGNSYKGYFINNNFNGYCIFNFNFSKNEKKRRAIMKENNKNNKNNIIINDNDELINILNNYNNLFDFYSELSIDKYNYSYIESYITENNINDIGIIKFQNNSSYIGEIKNNMRDGIGIFKWSDGSKYEGEFVKDRMEGWGQIYFYDGKIFKGQILDGVPHGYGEFIWNNENRYVGNYINGQKEGFGIYIMISESLKEHLSYFGFWKNGKQDGYGIIIKNKKMTYTKYKEGKKIAFYKNDIFIKEMLPFIDIKYRKVFLYDSKSLRKIIKNIIYY